MKKLIYILIPFIVTIQTACDDKHDLLVPSATDITFNGLSLEKFTHVIPENGFTSDGIHFNTVKAGNGDFSGFAYSRRSNRSFTFTGSREALDSNRFSVYTPRPNQTGVYTVVCVKGEDAFFSLDKKSVIEHILVANTTYAYWAMYYGEKTGNIANPNIPSAPKGVWYSYAPGVERPLNQPGDYFKLIIKGFSGGQLTGTVDFFLCCRKGANSGHPDFDFLRGDWIKADLTALGEVDKVVFNLESSYRDAAGNMLIPNYFCLDGIRLRQ